MSKPLVILGAGESGLGAARLAHKLGLPVFLSDAGPISEEAKEALRLIGADFEEGGHSAKVMEAQEVIKSPGIPDKAKAIQDLKGQGISVISEIEFAARHTEAKLVGITGTNGKTTTATLVQHLLKTAGKDSVLAGNVGDSFAGALAERDPDIFVLEISSFQLDDIKDFRPDVAVLLNITPDHLDRYPDFEAYADAKFRLGMNQTAEDAFIYCHDDTATQAGLQRNNISATMLPFSQKEEKDMSAYLDGTQLTIRPFDRLNTNTNTFSMSIYELALQGRHNQYNSMAAGIVGRVLELKDDAIRESLTDFQNVGHRLESLGTVDGVEFINDSKATNINAAWFALESMQTKVVLVMGGEDKGNDYSSMLELVKEKVKAIVCLGVDNTKIVEAFGEHVERIYETDSAEAAVRVSKLVALPGETVLLSPACASFDLFEDYQDRGNQFRAAVQAL